MEGTFSLHSTIHLLDPVLQLQFLDGQGSFNPTHENVLHSTLQASIRRQGCL
jgi:hypothetical protein